MSNMLPLSKQTIYLHWLIAISFIAALAFGLYVEDLPKGPEKGEMIGLHKSIGFIILVLASTRILWRVKEGALPSVPGSPSWQEKAAKGIHHLLLLATLLMPISGILMSVGGGRGLDVFGMTLIGTGDKIEWLGAIGHTTHEVLANIVIAAIVLHILGALKHHLLDKDATLKRMLGRD
ncbi:cytochrome b [Enterovibrio nigricans]|uniref:Cytochrome b561 n=1 Tax=Enterovibrio nigricans DSM 22720 TaxID=1121868 RepID=A0A1T4VVF0_9GAMM|nr:cytochrome b [Enterovibrio nigricans]PKF49316.1 cytochrome b [Enterovibrio nigricans]SKA68972.1 cytochrome b561 [Enterovibrio nigricans DSM 22720]